METTTELDPRLLEAAAARLEKKARRTYELSAAMRSGACPSWLSVEQFEETRRDLVEQEQKLEQQLADEIGTMGAQSQSNTEDPMADKCTTPQKSVKTGPKGPQGRGATSVRGNTGGKGKAPSGVKKFG